MATAVSRPASLFRAVVGALVGAFAAAVALSLATHLHPSILIEFDDDLPKSVASGFYQVERDAEHTFAWTGPLATLTLPGIDRDAAWRCTVRLRGVHPADLPVPEAAIGVDGITAATERGTLDYRDVVVDAPSSPRARSLTLTIRTTPTFVPRSSDRRELGVQVDRVSCAPQRSWILPPRRALVAAVTAGAAFGVLFGLVLPLPAAAAGLGLAAILLSAIVSAGMAAYASAYTGRIAPLAVWITGPVLLIVIARRSRKAAASTAAGFVIAFSSAVLFLKLAALLHPSKDIVDALFHAHRLDTVLAGNYFFTQPMPGGVRFPYAIGLYVMAAPWARIMPDHVALLRIVVGVFEAAAAALLYVAVVKSWNDRLAGAAAVVLYHLAPLPYIIVGNANLTFAFAQSVGVMTIVAATLLPFARPFLLSLVALTAIASLGFLSHVGVFPVLAATLIALGALYMWRGGREQRMVGIGVMGAAVLAAFIAVGSYYAHFPEVWSTLDRVSAPVADAAPDEAAQTARAAAPLSFGARVVRAVQHGVRAYGVPLVLLAVVGLWPAWRRGGDRLSFALAAVAIGFGLFAGFRIVAPVDARLQRYAVEFIDRLYYQMLPLVAVLGGCAAAFAWRHGAAARWLAAGVIGIAAFAAFGQLRAWVM